MSGPDPEDDTVQLGEPFECDECAGEIVQIFCPAGERHDELPIDLVRAIVVKDQRGRWFSVGLPEGLVFRPLH